MHSRDDAIMLVLHMLQEDIVDQFHIKEVTAALDGDQTFSINNKIGECVTLRCHPSVFLYEITSCQLFIKSRKRICDHQSLKKDVHKHKYICLDCGLVANMEYFNNKKER